MGFCVKCGTQVPENSTVCPNCGTPVGGQQPAYQQQPYQQPYQPVYVKNDFSDEMAPEDIQRGRTVSMLSYVSIVFSIFALVAEPNNKFVRFHVNQALVLQICMMLSALCAIIPFLGWAVAGVANIVFFIFAIIGFFNAKAGRAKEVPAVGKYRPLK